MDDGYQGLDKDLRGGCLAAAAAGLLALVVDFGRFFGDPAPGTESFWWRQIPVFVPTLVITISTFLIVRALKRRHISDDSCERSERWDVGDSIPLRVLKLRIRNNIIDYLEVASSPSEQRDFERRVPSACLPDEMINWWEDLCVPDQDFDWFSEPEFSPEEQEAIRRFYEVWDSVAGDTPDVMPRSIEVLIGTRVWQRLIDGASVALSVFRVRGRISETAPL